MNTLRRIAQRNALKSQCPSFGGIASPIATPLTNLQGGACVQNAVNVRSFHSRSPFQLVHSKVQFSELHQPPFYDDEVDIPESIKPSNRQYIFFSVNFSPTLDMKLVHETIQEDYKLHSNSKTGLVYERLDAEGKPFEIPQYILVYPFGSVTFVNIEEEVRYSLINRLKFFQQYTNDQLRLRFRGNKRLISPSSDLKGGAIDRKMKYEWNEQFMITEHNVVVQRDDLGLDSDEDPVYCQMGENDEVEVAMLDIDTVRIISSVLAKSAALKVYEEMAEGALEEARIMNTYLKNKTLFTSTEVSRLVEQVATSEEFRLGIDLLIKVKEIPKKAWNRNRYYQVFLLMQSEHENEERYAEIKEIISTVIESNRFQVDLWNAFKNERLEIIIILLIAMELLVNIPYAIIYQFFSGLLGHLTVKPTEGATGAEGEVSEVKA